jgi:hypothetical protein
MAEGLLYISRGKRTPVIDKSSWNEGDDIRSYLPGKEEGERAVDIWIPDLIYKSTEWVFHRFDSNCRKMQSDTWDLPADRLGLTPEALNGAPAAPAPQG